MDSNPLVDFRILLADRVYRIGAVFHQADGDSRQNTGLFDSEV